MSMQTSGFVRRLAGLCANLALLLLALGIALLAAEYITRFVMRDITSTSNMQTWFGHRWRAEYVSLNSQGYREIEIPADKSPDSFRISVIGDSFTFGVGLPVEHRLSNELQNQLSQNCGGGIEVYNYGIAGLNTVRELDLLREDVLPADPDLVILQWLPNDVEDFSQGFIQPEPFPLMPVSGHKMLIRNSALYYLFYKFWRETSGKDSNEYQTRLLTAAADSAVKQQQVVEFIETVRNAGKEVVVVMFPLFAKDPQAGYQMQPVHEIPLAACRQTGALCLDLLPVYEAEDEAGDLRKYWVNSLDPHPSHEANLIAVSALLREADWGSFRRPSGERLNCATSSL